MNYSKLFFRYSSNYWKYITGNINIKRYSRSVSTIFALSSGHGKCAISVFRISGPNAKIALLNMGKFLDLPDPRVANLRKIYHPKNNDLIDRGIVIWHPGPKSFTGEDYCEFHVHGGIAIIQAMMSALSTLPQYRLAEPGEFTKRAFLENKLDLVEVEGLADLINAETEVQRKQALRQMTGELSKLYNLWRNKLLQSLAHTEAYIDFSEDQNIEGNIMALVVKNMGNLLQEIGEHLNDHRKGERLRSGINIVIIGEPNVGKSSLLNKICQRPAAIVSSLPGTTRDIVEILYDIDGYPVHISDTAGLRATDNIVEKEGIARAHQRLKIADLVLWMIDAKKYQSFLKQQDEANILNNLLKDTGIDVSNSGNSEECNSDEQPLNISKDSILFVINKIDLVECNWKLFNTKQNKFFPISCLSGENFKEFMTCLGKKIAQMCANPETENMFLTSSRHRINLEQVQKYLESFLTLYNNDVVIAAEALRKALHHIGKITGDVSSSQILDVIFKEFCIGK